MKSSDECGTSGQSRSDGAASKAIGCPFDATAASDDLAPREVPVYQRPLGVLHNAGVRREIAALDAESDCERIAYLLSAYEFPFDMTRSLEAALFHTYGSRSVAQLLDHTGQFKRHGQKRYDDTNVLIAQFIEAGSQAPLGRRAITRMNEIHSHYRIPNDDFLFVLWTFIDFPIQWMAEFGWRPFTPHERAAWLHYWLRIGEQMGMRELPVDKPAFDAFVLDYEAREFVPNAASTRVTSATVAIMQGWLPRPLRGLVQPVAASLARPAFLRATGLPRPGRWMRGALRALLKVRARLKAWISMERYPTLLADKTYRSYPLGIPSIEQLGPAGLDGPRRSPRSASTPGPASSRP
jgi:hypothetical protein